MQPTAVIATRLEGAQAVSIADVDFLDPNAQAWIPWINEVESRLTRCPSSAFRGVLEKKLLQRISDISRLLCAELTLVASTPELEPIRSARTGLGSIFYVRPLIWDASDNKLAPRLDHFAARPRDLRRFCQRGGRCESITLLRI